MFKSALAACTRKHRPAGIGQPDRGERRPAVRLDERIRIDVAVIGRGKVIGMSEVGVAAPVDDAVAGRVRRIDLRTVQEPAHLKMQMRVIGLIQDCADGLAARYDLSLCH